MKLDLVQLFPSERSNLGDSSNHKFKNLNINRNCQSIFQEWRLCTAVHANGPVETHFNARENLGLWEKKGKRNQ